jgi:hypothetical protein
MLDTARAGQMIHQARLSTPNTPQPARLSLLLDTHVVCGGRPMIPL